MRTNMIFTTEEMEPRRSYITCPSSSSSSMVESAQKRKPAQLQISSIPWHEPGFLFILQRWWLGYLPFYTKDHRTLVIICKKAYDDVDASSIKGLLYNGQFSSELGWRVTLLCFVSYCCFLTHVLQPGLSCAFFLISASHMAVELQACSEPSYLEVNKAVLLTLCYWLGDDSLPYPNLNSHTGTFLLLAIFLKWNL
jgi:hypothetical protein